jgi:hypothetical protein
MLFGLVLGIACVVAGIAFIFNLGGAADWSSRANKSSRGSAFQPGFAPESRGGHRLLGAAVIVIGIVLIVAGIASA